MRLRIRLSGHAVLVEEWYHPIVQQVGRHQRKSTLPTNTFTLRNTQNTGTESRCSSRLESKAQQNQVILASEHVEHREHRKNDDAVKTARRDFLEVSPFPTAES